MKNFIKQRLREQMINGKEIPDHLNIIDGQNMNQGTQEMCNLMSVKDYPEVLCRVKKALEGLKPELRHKIIQKIKYPLNSIKQQQIEIDKEVNTLGMSGDSMLDESNTYWVMIQSAFCELGQDFQ